MIRSFHKKPMGGEGKDHPRVNITKVSDIGHEGTGTFVQAEKEPGEKSRYPSNPPRTPEKPEIQIHALSLLKDGSFPRCKISFETTTPRKGLDISFLKLRKVIHRLRPKERESVLAREIPGQLRGEARLLNVTKRSRKLLDSSLLLPSSSFQKRGWFHSRPARRRCGGPGKVQAEKWDARA